MQIIQIELFIENGISTVRSTNSSILQLGDGRIKDLKFIDDSTILVLWEANGKAHSTLSSRTNMALGECNLLGIPYNTEGGAHIKYHPHRLSASRSKAIILSNEEVIDKFLQTEFAGERSIAPENMIIRPQIDSKRSNDMKRLVILAKDKLRYKVFKWAGAPPDKDADEDIPMS